MSEIQKLETSLTKDFYSEIAQILKEARSHTYRAINSVMVKAYWEIGCRIVEEQGGEERAEYGSKLIKELSIKLTSDFGKGFTVTNLKYMRQFYQAFPIGHALRGELSWTHYRSLLRVSDEAARQWYMNEAANEGWSSRTLDRNIQTQYYYRLLQSQDSKRPAVKAEMEAICEPFQQDKLEFIKNPVVAEFLGLAPNGSF